MRHLLVSCAHIESSLPALNVVTRRLTPLVVGIHLLAVEAPLGHLPAAILNTLPGKGVP
jgi:hypothetical protein